jgi:aminopeptidase N
MKNNLRFWIVISFILFFNYSFFAQSPDERVRTFDVEHIKLDVSLDLEKKVLDGKVTTTIRSLTDKLNEIKLDAVGMNIKSVKMAVYAATDKPELAEQYEDIKFDYNKKILTIYPKTPVSQKFPFKFMVEYSVTDPERGLYFIQPTPVFPDKPFQVWTQGEGEDNRYWFPCYDYPNEQQTVETIIKVDSKYQTLSNGILKNKTINPDGTASWQWVTDKPFVSYLVMIAIGNWDIIEDSWDGIPVLSYVPPGTKNMAVKSFEKTADMMKFFNSYTGFRYPWKSFSQVAVEDFIYGGMENTGAVVLFEGTVYDDRTPPDYTATGIVAHELVHQWWGDVVTCRNWNEIWLNESFATYFQCLYTEYAFGKDEFDYNIFRNGRNSLNADSLNVRRPIYAKETIGTNTYDKGSVVLNMLRKTIGDENFKKAINIYITDNQFTSVTTNRFIDAVNKALDDPLKDRTPINMKWFFDEWIFSAGQPEYKVSYIYNESSKELTFNSEQVQRMDTSTVFKTPVPVKIVTKSGTIYNEYFVMDKNPYSFTYKIDDEPLYVLFNRGNAVLCKLYFDKPKKDWLNQWHYSEDAIDKITALYGMKDLVDDPNVLAALDESLNKSAFWGVRYEAAAILGTSKTYTALEMLMLAYDSEKDSRVRKTIMSSIANVKVISAEHINTEWLYGWIKKYIETEQSYYCIAEGINAISRILKKEEIYDAVTPFLNQNSHSEIIRRTVMYALDSSKDERSLQIFMEYAEKGSIARLRNGAVNGLANFLNDGQVVDYLNNKVLDKPRSTQYIILNLLEKAKNPASKPYLEQLLEKTNDERLITRVKEILGKL